MPYNCIESCPLWEDRQKTTKTIWRVAVGTVIKIEESYPRGADLEVSMIRTLGQIPVYNKDNPLALGKMDGWLDGKYFVEGIVSTPENEPTPDDPEFDEVGRALDVLVRFVTARL